MESNKSNTGIKRRQFLKAGLLGATSAVIAESAVADVTNRLAATSGPAPPKPMKPVLRTLGRTGLKITTVSFGAMLTPEPEVIKIALDHGLNYIDTARVYMGGKNEDIVGRAIKGRRASVYVGTKTTSTTKEGIIRDVETSLKTLDTDYIDVIQLHGLEDKDRIHKPDVREALTILKQQGKVRFFGVTSHKNHAAVLNAVVDDKDRFFDTVLIAYNFKSEKNVADAIARAAKAKIGVIAMKTQAGGYVTQEMGMISPHQAALKWVLRNTNVTAAVPGMRNLAELKENTAVMGMPFEQADNKVLQRYGKAISPYYCTFCGQCEGSCPRGVDISMVNRSLMYAEGYKNRELARLTYQALPEGASAASCDDCSECTAKCVNGLVISTKMKQARLMLA